MIDIVLSLFEGLPARRPHARLILLARFRCRLPTPLPCLSACFIAE
ncbi:hypothetical protein [Fibrella aquatilis]|uniref:Uncharacterized protein n=1 Tax=Fibrella aquatilis TaxID=2817059 RepID=A0A939G091_9BACT|nr:hypothetical protein [Fibrella aquatilis]MBO0929491.1 hypothetical protein [Fibrella aquatilis]